MHRLHRLAAPAAALLLLTLLSHTACGATLLRDDFNGTSLNQAVWRLPTGDGTFFGRTQIRPPSQAPVVSNGVVTLLLDTHNPTAGTPGDSFWGHEIQTRTLFSVGDGLSIKSRLRFVDGAPLGRVGGFFTYGIEPPFQVRDEIDFELLSNDAGDQTIFTNVFDDDDFSVGGDSRNVFVSGLDITQFTEYEIRWLPDRIQWFVDGQLIRVETGTVTDDPQEVRINHWAPDVFFSNAFDASLQPVASPALNESFALEVDYVEVTQISPGDYDIDGDVDVADILKWQRGESFIPLSPGDKAVWEANFGSPNNLAATAVPEPASAALAGLLVACLWGHRRHGKP
ncbi:MAG: family 16 glycosylhydrolase [Planctomycetota bacterium]